MKKLIIIGICILIIIVLAIMWYSRPSEITTDSGYRVTFAPNDLIQCFNDNYLVFSRIAERISDDDGYFYTNYGIDEEGHTIAKTNIESINNLDVITKKEFNNDINFIIEKLHFVYITMDEKTNIVYFTKEHNLNEGQGIVYTKNRELILNRNLKTNKDNWYYYYYGNI